jgi:opacity protein-like surface antigen
MKKILVLAFLAALSASSLWAEELVTSEPDPFGPNQQWIERVEGTFGVPASSDVSSAVNLGFGGGLAIGYRLEPHLSISLSSGYYQYSIKNIPSANTGGYFSYVPLETVINCNFGDGTFRPYVSFGVGAAFNTYSLSSSAQGSALQSNVYETSFFMSPAIGFLQIISPRAALFLEARADMDFRSNTALGMANGMPSIFIPIQAGLTFFVI